MGPDDHTERAAAPKPIDVFVVVGVRLYEEGIARALHATTGIRVSGTAPDWREALVRMATSPPDIVLLDLALEESVGATRAIRAVLPETRLVALAVREVEGDVVAWAETGVEGLVSRDASLSDLVDEIRSVARGETLCSPWLAALLLRHVGALARERGSSPALPVLTTRELEVIRLLDRGLSNKEIAGHLHIQLPTVKNHVHNILEKLGVRRRAEAVALMRTSGD